MNTATKNLMFLLSAAPMALGGCLVTVNTDGGDGNETSGSAGDGDNDATETSSGTGDGDGDATTTGDGDGDPATGDGDGDATGDGDGDATGDGDGDAMTTGDGDGDPAPSACASYGDFIVECIPDAAYDAAYYEAVCQTYIDSLNEDYGADCAMAYEAFFACLTELPCMEWAPGACQTEQDLADMTCFG